MTADILGFSLRFPESESPSAFWQNLIRGVDMQTSDARRWPVGLHNTPPRLGKIPNIDAFDNIFFSIHGKQAKRLDPQARKLLEVGATRYFLSVHMSVLATVGPSLGSYQH